MNIELTEDDKKYLEFVAKIGFQYCEVIKSMPEDIKSKLSGYFDLDRTECQNKRMSNMVFSYSAKVLALKRGFSPEDRKSYLKIKKSNKHFEIK